MILQQQAYCVSEDRFMDILDTLKKLAQRSVMVHKHSACLLHGERVFAYGINKIYKSNDVVKVSIHAEIDALINIKMNRRKGMDIFIIRMSKKNKLANSRPCNSCIDKLKENGLRKAYYSNSEGNIVYEFVDNMPKIHENSLNTFRRCGMYGGMMMCSVV
jgi:deoxycytidylate deaminase